MSPSVPGDGGLVGESGRGDGRFGLAVGEFDLGSDPAAANGRPPTPVGLSGPDGQTAGGGDTAEGEVVGGQAEEGVGSGAWEVEAVGVFGWYAETAWVGGRTGPAGARGGL
ncbi:hypothetical protein [Amycolatopsis echigonensis]|uniref:hypothetical protein n=1 Tax=Amycolatopsis echigonensis TaxID=2576905 RepID=UPI001FE30659|nr:hypothetical protein [Amycolatopsis echigonensis]